MNFNWLEQLVYKNPHSIFLRVDEKKITFLEIYESANDYVRLLTSLGITKNSKVAVYLDEPIEIIKTFLACMNIGAIFTPIKSQLKNRELEIALKHLCPDLIITNRKLTKNIQRFDFITCLIDELQNVQSTTTKNIKINENDVCAILFTSGTSGKPKAVQLTYSNFLSNAEMWNDVLNFSDDDNYLNCMPLDHIGGISIIFRALIYGFSVTLANRFNAQNISRLIDQKNISLISLVPTMLQKIVDNRGDRTFPKELRTILLGGGLASEKLLKFCIKHNLPIYKTYGMTETASGVAGFYLNDYPEKISSVGTPFNNTIINIANDEIVISSPSVMKCYLNQPDSKGVHCSGDLGKFDEDGFLYLDIRRNDLIVTGGENVNPSEVEDVINSHPKIKSSKVVGIKDDKWGQKVIAYVVMGSVDLALGTWLVDWCKERLSNYKVPKEFIEVDKSQD